MAVKQSFARWCFGNSSIKDLCVLAQRVGFAGIDLVDPADWLTLKSHGLVCSLAPSHPINQGLNHPKHHADCERLIRNAIDESAEGGCPNVVCFSGNRGEMDDAAGARHCIDALRRLAPFAEEKGVTLCLELLNSKEHQGYMCDRTAWGVGVCEAVGSERVRLLYDVYHMQRMEGDLVDTIRRHARWFGHIHTAGVPGRHELDDAQEIFYPAVLKALRVAGYEGWIGHEFLPRGEAESALTSAFQLVQVHS